MAPLLSAAGLFLGQNPVLVVRKGGTAVWEPGGPGGLPEIGASFEGGFFAGLISHTADNSPTHALVVAPRNTGASGTEYPMTSNYAYRSSTTQVTGSGSLFDGVANTNNLVSLGVSSFPAANFCASLSISGYSDWYLPAVLELDAAYKNLKPSANSNSTSWGINAYAVPPRAANHISSDPAQTSVPVFAAPGGGERFVSTVGGDTHWSSSINSANFSQAWRLGWANGARSVITLTASLHVRAFRRVPV